jgi:hypothetical protein
MLDWLVRDHKIIENISVLVTLAVAAWTLYEARARLRAAYKIAGIWISSIIAPEYKEANRKRREKVTKAKLRYLTRFGHKQEMECLSKVYSRLSTHSVSSLMMLFLSLSWASSSWRVSEQFLRKKYSTNLFHPITRTVPFDRVDRSRRIVRVDFFERCGRWG